ncbi:alanine racemase [Petralouisia muris]|jgi:alanine racemase|uniref:Alanine racemase n=1 Tax=Petralouisia muris TaxID=3032872 RepID=A0AC61S0W0_9FIRM|nr:alanine racemase [Petralouisia muris]TGY98106.1 alanine racemase [Petralouisia muris]
MKSYSRAYAEINLDAVIHNISQMEKAIGKDTKIIGVIKADGYGHGAVPIGKELERLESVWGYAVATAEEAAILRRNELKKPVLVLGTVFPEQYGILAKQEIRATVYSMKQAKGLEDFAKEQGQSVRIHLKIDTGLSRLGFQVTEEAADELAQIVKMPHMIVEGIFTHFAKADAQDKTMAKDQFRQFLKMKEMLAQRGISIPVSHCANSAAMIDMPKTNMSLVRAGISLYGLWPSDEVRKEHLDLQPALSLKSRIVFLKELKPGRTVSYGATYETKKTQRIATIPVGYADGYARSLSNRGYVLIHGKAAPICGRICMDQFMADVTDIPEAAEGDTVTLIGRDGSREISMEEIGDLSGRFNYEFACDLGKRIPRVYVREGKVTETRDYFGE